VPWSRRKVHLGLTKSLLMTGPLTATCRGTRYLKRSCFRWQIPSMVNHPPHARLIMRTLTSLNIAPSPGFSVFTPASTRSPSPWGEFETGRVLSPFLIGLMTEMFGRGPKDQTDCSGVPLPTIEEDLDATVDDMQQPYFSLALPTSAGPDFETAEDVVLESCQLSFLSRPSEYQSTPINALIEVSTAKRVREENEIIVIEGVHRPSPYCAWPTAEEMKADRLWFWSKMSSRETALVKNPLPKKGKDPATRSPLIFRNIPRQDDCGSQIWACVSYIYALRGWKS
jgi:hypothetical protein